MWHDLLRDWNRWSLLERLLAVLVIAGILLIQVPLIF
jgi:competence protein ComGF